MKRARSHWICPVSKDVFGVVLSFLHDEQINYWITQVDEDGPLLRWMMECTRSLDYLAFANIFKICICGLHLPANQMMRLKDWCKNGGSFIICNMCCKHVIEAMRKHPSPPKPPRQKSRNAQKGV